MTDLETLKAMLTRATIPFREQTRGKVMDWPLRRDPNELAPNETLILLYEVDDVRPPDEAHLIGFPGFWLEYLFRDGALVRIGLWE